VSEMRGGEGEADGGVDKGRERGKGKGREKRGSNVGLFYEF
jgi:hypothetical protein